MTLPPSIGIISQYELMFFPTLNCMPFHKYIPHIFQILSTHARRSHKPLDSHQPKPSKSTKRNIERKPTMTSRSHDIAAPQTALSYRRIPQQCCAKKNASAVRSKFPDFSTRCPYLLVGHIPEQNCLRSAVVAAHWANNLGAML
jgi:hypothetical protein